MLHSGASGSEAMAAQKYKYHSLHGGIIIDRNLSIMHTASALIIAFGLSSMLGALASARGARYKLQCALASSSCCITWLYYNRALSIRSTPEDGYSLEGNAAVDSLRFSTWMVCSALQAWMTLLIRGPFEAKAPFLGATYDDWLWIAPLLCSASVVCGGAAMFFSEAAQHRSASRSERALNVFFTVVSVSLALASATVSTAAVQQNTDPTQRSAREGSIGIQMSHLWVLYPLVACSRALLEWCTRHHFANQMKERLPPTGFQLTQTIGLGLESSVVTALQAVSGARSISRIAIDSEAKLPKVSPLYMQILEICLAVVDVFVIAIPAMIVTTFSFGEN